MITLSKVQCYLSSISNSLFRYFALSSPYMAAGTSQ